MTSFDLFLKEQINKQIKINDLEILKDVETKNSNLIKKITNFLSYKITENEKNNISIEDILNMIKTNLIIRAMFRKDAIKQSIHENSQIEWIKKNQYNDVVKMNSSINGTCIQNNKLHIIKNNSRRSSKATKTFDIFIPSINTYGVLKYTSTSGGSQDNQFNDVKHFILNEISYLENNNEATEKFITYIDGDFYSNKKFKELEDLIPDKFKNQITITKCANIKII